jgi:hypothetical protein
VGGRIKFFYRDDDQQQMGKSKIMVNKREVKRSLDLCKNQMLLFS